MRSHVSTKESVSKKTHVNAEQDGMEPLVSSVNVWFPVSMVGSAEVSTSADVCLASQEITVR